MAKWSDIQLDTPSGFAKNANYWSNYTILYLDFQKLAKLELWAKNRTFSKVSRNLFPNIMYIKTNSAHLVCPNIEMWFEKVVKIYKFNEIRFDFFDDFMVLLFCFYVLLCQIDYHNIFVQVVNAYEPCGIFISWKMEWSIQRGVAELNRQ